jgi:hypothetical protein
MKKYISVTLLGAFVVLMSGCKKFIDVNTNPNNATTTQSQLVFTGALGTSYRNQVSTNMMIVPGTWTGMYAHSTSFTGGGAEKSYAITSSDFNAFDGIYDNISDYNYVIQNADKDGVAFWKDPSEIMKCYMFHMLVDLYGDVPYFQSMQGITNLTPKYDDDQAIYEDLVVRLDSSMARIKRATWPTSTDFTNQDIMFQGNKDNWIRFANTIKLRILMNQDFMSGRDTYITTNVNNTLANGYITGNVLVSPGYQNVSGKLNPFYANFGYNELNNVAQNHSYRKMNAVIINFLKNTADTFRLQSLSWPIGGTVTAPSSSFGSYVGIPLGAGTGFATASSSAIGPFQVQQGQGTRPGMVMTYAEALLLQSEATQRFGLTFPGGSAKTLYEAGVTAHFNLCAAPSTVAGSATIGAPFATRYLARSVNIPGFAAGMNSSNVNWDLSADKLRSILMQKWVAYVHINGTQAWTDYRKSYVSASTSVPYSVRTSSLTSNPEPVRFPYPISEENTNATNVPKNVSVFTSKVFWDVN